LEKKWKRKKGIRLCDEYVGKVVDEKREALRRFLSTNKLEDKRVYNRERATAKLEVRTSRGKVGKEFYRI
jgi:hypothetical protein